MAKDKLSNVQKGKEKLKEAKEKVKNLLTQLTVLGAIKEQQKPAEAVITYPVQLNVEKQKNEAAPIDIKKLYRDFTPEDWAKVDEEKRQALERYEKIEAKYQNKLRLEAQAQENEKQFQEYIVKNPPSINQYKTPTKNTMREKDPVVIQRALMADDVFKDFVETEDQTIEKLKNINQHQITPNIQNYFKQDFDIELGNIDLSYQRIDTEKAQLKGDTYAAVYLAGKKANNTLALSKRIYNAIQDYKGITEQTINQESINMLTGLTHEALHKMFNLDNRLSIDKGANFENDEIKLKNREGMVEYFARQVMRSSLANNDKINFSQKMIAIDSIRTSETYKEFVDTFDNYLRNMAIKFAFSNDPNKTNKFNDNHRYIEKLAAQFFLSSDDSINQLASKLGLPGIMEI
jgi:hypothetical protein